MPLSTQKKFLSDVILYGTAQTLAGLRTFLFLPIFAHFATVEEYGLFTQLILIITLLSKLASSGLDIATQRFLAAEEDKAIFQERFYGGLLWNIIILVILSIFLIISAPISAQFILGEAEYYNFIIIGTLLLVMTGISQYLSNYYTVIHRVAIVSAIFIAHSVIGLGFILLLFYLGYGTKSAIWALIIVRSGFSAGLLLVVGRRVGRFRFNWDKLRDMLAFSLPLVPNMSLQWAINYADRIVIIQFMGIAAAGIYSAAYSLSSGLIILSSSMGYVLFPLTSRLWNTGEINLVKRYFTYITRYYLFLSIPACIGLTLISQSLLQIMAKPEFMSSTVIVFLISLGIMLRGFYRLSSYVFYLVSKTKYLVLVASISVVVNLGLNIFLVPKIGLTGAALATTATFLLMAMIIRRYGQLWIDYKINWLDIGKSIGAAIMMATGIYWLPPATGISNIILTIIFGVSVYIAFLFLLRTISKAEAFQLRQLILSFVPGHNMM